MEAGRRTERTQLIYQLRVFDAESGAFLGHIANLTSKGIMLFGDCKLTVGERIRIRVNLPKNVMGNGNLQLEVLVRWSRQSGDSTALSSGLEAVNLSPEATDAIGRLIEQFPHEYEENIPFEDLEHYFQRYVQ